MTPKDKEPINHKNANLNNLNYLIPKKEPNIINDWLDKNECPQIPKELCKVNEF